MLNQKWTCQNQNLDRRQLLWTPKVNWWDFGVSDKYERPQHYKIPHTAHSGMGDGWKEKKKKKALGLKQTSSLY